MVSSGTGESERGKRGAAANKYRPELVKLLLIAEAPPRDLSRYFYFEDVQEHDSLFRYVVRVILDEQPNRAEKQRQLERLQELGVFLIDLKLDPVDGSSLSQYVDDLIERCRDIDPERIVLIKATIYDAAFRRLADAGLPVVNVRIPFPGSGQQRRFLEAFTRAIEPFISEQEYRT